MQCLLTILFEGFATTVPPLTVKKVLLCGDKKKVNVERPGPFKILKNHATKSAKILGVDIFVVSL